MGCSLLGGLCLWLGATPELHFQVGHSWAPSVMQISPDGRNLLSWASHEPVRLWDVATGRELADFPEVDDEFAMACAPDFSYYAVWLRSNVVCRDPRTGRERARFSIPAKYVSGGAIASDGSLVLQHEGGELFAHDPLKGGASRRLWRYGSPIWRLSGDRVFVLSNASAVHVLSVGSAAELARYSMGTNRLYGQYFLVSEPLGLAIITDGNLIHVADLQTGERKFTLTHGSRGQYVRPVLSPDGLTLATGNGWEGSLRRWDLTSGKLLVRVETGLEGNHVGCSPDGKWIFSGGSDNAVALRDARTLAVAKAFRGFADRLTKVAFAPDGTQILTGAWDRTLKLVDRASGRPVRTFAGHRHTIESIAFSPDGRSILSGGFDRTVRLWDRATGATISVFSNLGSIGAQAVLFLPGDRIFVGSDDYLGQILQRPSGTPVATVTNGYRRITAACLSPDQRRIYTGHLNGNIRGFDASTLAPLFDNTNRHSIQNSLAVSPDGRTLVAAGFFGALSFYDAATGELLRVVANERASHLRDAVFSPDGRTVVAASSDLVLRAFDVQSGRVVRTFEGHRSIVSSCALSPDGRRLASIGLDKTLRLWNFATGELLYTMVALPNGKDYLVWTPEGYFDGTEAALRDMLHVVDGLEVLPADRLFETYFRPDLVRAKAAGEDLSALRGPNLKNGLRPPPETSLLSLREDARYLDAPASEEPKLRLEGPTVRLKARARDAGGGVDSLRLTLNGKLVGEGRRGMSVSAAKGWDLEADFAVVLAEGSNRIALTAFSGELTESAERVLWVPYRPPILAKPDLHVLAVGINEYRNPKYQLNYAVADAKGFVDSLRGPAGRLFGRVQVASLLDRDATRARLLETLGELKARMKSADVFVFFYAGHGIALDVPNAEGKAVNEFFYVLPDVTQMTSAEKCAAESLSGTELRRAIAAFPVSKAVLFVDACNSGAFANQFAVRGAAEENALAKLSRATGSVIFASTTKEQFATEFAALRHGLFTYVVMEAFSGRASMENGSLTAKSIMAYVEDKIPEYSRKYRGEEQFPTTFIWGQDFPLGLRP